MPKVTQTIIFVTVALVSAVTAWAIETDADESSTVEAGPVETGTVETETLWRVETGEPIYARPVVDGEVLYVGGEDGNLRAIERGSGEVRWTYSAGAAIASDAGFDEARVYVSCRDGSVHGVDKASGERVWRLVTDGEKQWDPWDIFLSTPVPDAKQWLYVGSGDHHIYSINKRSGVLRWKTRTGAIVHGSPVLDGEKVIVGSYDGKLYGLDQANGRVLWTFKTVGNAYFRDGEIAGSPTVADGIVYFGSRDYNLYAVLAETGTGAWNERTPSWVIARPLVVDGTVYAGTSDGPRLFAFDAKTGQEKWATPLGLNVFGTASHLGEGHVAVAGVDGRINLIERESGKIVGFHDTAEATKNRGSMFDDEGNVDTSTIKSWEDLFALYDRFYRDLGGIAGGVTVEDDVIYYATGGGGIAAVKVSGLQSE